MKTTNKELLAAFAKKIEEWEKNPERMQSGYDYEKTFVEMWQSLGKDVFQNSIGTLPKSRNGKKNSKRVRGK